MGRKRQFRVGRFDPREHPLTRKYSCMSVSAGGRRCRRVYRWINARYWPCLGVKDFPERLTPAIRFSCASVPRSMRRQG